MGVRYDFTGKTCGCWKVIERDKNPKSKSHETFWLCECQRCGNVASVRATDLKKEPRSCNNCKGSVIQDIMAEKGLTSYKIGDRYGLLTIIGREPMRNNHTYVTCKCDCGNIISVRLAHLKGQCHGRTISCGCAKRSSGEIKIEQCIQDYNYQCQYIIPELSKFMPFDFAIFKNGQLYCLIEYDGEQHYRAIDHFGGEEQYKLQQENDKRRDQFCSEYNLKLIRVPYYDYDKITVNYMKELIEGED